MMNLKKLANDLDKIASGVEYSENTLTTASELKFLSEDKKDVISRYLDGSDSATDRFRLQDIAVDIRENGEKFEKFQALSLALKEGDVIDSPAYGKLKFSHHYNKAGTQMACFNENDNLFRYNMMKVYEPVAPVRKLGYYSLDKEDGLLFIGGTYADLNQFDDSADVLELSEFIEQAPELKDGQVLYTFVLTLAECNTLHDVAGK